ncbi:Gfo/Idh/MocA family protein [Vagococcus hydrophili]|uniref:Gfo/Idh/MocA family protein n=1 Tax=Vagococcus hydrophili TaxID=2714947 RepID=UPI001EEB01F2|nr:Gfo/Idh/MocA family oxidoreductase [Vagococcus hydrophili]
MKIGIIGLGNIFQKAYLPTLSENRQLHTYYFASKNEETKNRLKNNYGFTNFVETLDDLLDLGIEACMIHSATVAHYEVAKKCLNSGIHVLMDKPLSEEYEETKELIELAEEKNVTLMTGFNRRFAPNVDVLKGLSNKRVIYLEKNRVFSEYDSKFAVYDLFLHLVDTAVYLLDSSNIKIISSHIEETDTLDYVTLTLQANQTKPQRL